jgi:hypothetical protein
LIEEYKDEELKIEDRRGEHAEDGILDTPFESKINVVKQKVDQTEESCPSMIDSSILLKSNRKQIRLYTMPIGFSEAMKMSRKNAPCRRRVFQS